MARDKNYSEEAQQDARQMLDHFADEIADQAREGEVSDDYNNDYSNGDSYHHETHVDHDYDLTEAAAILDALSDDEETDSGLWEGLEPRRAISCQAAYTYGNAVYSRWSALIKELNTDILDGLEGEDVREGFARLWLILLCDFDADRNPTGDYAALARTAYEAICRGEAEGAGPLADKLEDMGGHGWKAFRKAYALAITPPEVEEDDEEESLTA